jgi:tRNA dimethylallyltransferase
LHVKSRAHRRAVGIEKKKKNTTSIPEQSRETLQTNLVDVLEDYLQAFPEEESIR